MAELKFQKPGVNAARLCAELATELGDALEGVAQNGDEIEVCLRDGSDYDAKAIEALVLGHVGGLDEFQAREEKRQLAAVQVVETDFEAIKAAIGDVQDPQAQVLFTHLLEVVNRLAAVQVGAEVIAVAPEPLIRER